MKHRLTLLRSLIILLAGSFLVLPSAYAENEISHTPIDEELQQAEEKTQKGDFTSLTKSLKEGGNIYDTAYALAKKASIKDANDAFKSISENLNSQYSCSLSANDISNVAATNVQLNAAFGGLADKSAFAISGDKVAESCFKIAQCVRQADHEPNSSSIEESYTLESYPLCTSTIQKAFTETIGVIGKVNRLSNANHGDDIFYNGKLDDSPFDLLVDIQLIGDVLFRNNTKAPEVTLYGSQQANGSSAGGNGGSNNTSLNYQDFSPEEFMQLAMNATDLDSSVLSLMNEDEENTLLTDGYTSTIGLDNDTKNSALEALSLYNQNSTHITSVAAANNVLCISGTSVSNLVQPNTITPLAIAAQQGAQTEDYLSSYLTSLDGFTENTQNQTQGATNLSSDGNWSVFGTNAANGQTSAGNPIQATGAPDTSEKSCMQKCDSQAPAHKALCIARCLCTTTSSNNGMFAVRVCPIPALNPNIVKDKTIKSTEEAGDEIDNVLTKLRDSGQLMKHIKPKEFMESALSKIKLNEIAAFDMNTNFKPVYDSRKDKEEEEKKKSEDNATVNRAHQGDYRDQSVGKEKNKYIVLQNPLDQEKNNSNLGSEELAPPPPQPDVDTPYTKAKTMNNDMLNNMQTYTIQSKKLWQQTQDTLKLINITSENLRKKVMEKGY